MNKGMIIQVIGAVVDVEFPQSAVPQVYDALQVKRDQEVLTLEVQQQLGGGVVRTIAMGTTDGLQRGIAVENTKAPISVPVGEGDLRAYYECLGATC